MSDYLPQAETVLTLFADSLREIPIGVRVQAECRSATPSNVTMST